jgi:pimeloyl-ACP methyl ester carboxylesterase
VRSDIPSPSESRVLIGNTPLYLREAGRGHPLIVLHGGPDFDHSYLLPDLDQLADEFWLIYYDQRGRGQSAEEVQPTDITLTSDIDDVRAVMETSSCLQQGCWAIRGARCSPWNSRLDTPGAYLN